MPNASGGSPGMTADGLAQGLAALGPRGAPVHRRRRRAASGRYAIQPLPALLTGGSASAELRAALASATRRSCVPADGRGATRAPATPGAGRAGLAGDGQPAHLSARATPARALASFGASARCWRCRCSTLCCPAWCCVRALRRSGAADDRLSQRRRTRALRHCWGCRPAGCCGRRSRPPRVLPPPPGGPFRSAISARRWPLAVPIWRSRHSRTAAATGLGRPAAAAAAPGQRLGQHGTLSARGCDRSPHAATNRLPRRHAAAADAARRSCAAATPSCSLPGAGLGSAAGGDRGGPVRPADDRPAGARGRRDGAAVSAASSRARPRPCPMRCSPPRLAAGPSGRPPGPGPTGARR